MAYPGDLLGDIELLKSLADLSDEISSARFLAQDLKIESKPDLSPVTDADKAVEEKIREVLSAQRPNDKIVGEEFGSAEDIKAMDRYWVIDPIDGTKNFLRGLPIWATLIGLVHRNESGQDRVIAGMVSSPALFRRWYAAEGFGAFTEVNSGTAIQIKASNVKEISDASISFSASNNSSGIKVYLYESKETLILLKGYLNSILFSRSRSKATIRSFKLLMSVNSYSATAFISSLKLSITAYFSVLVPIWINRSHLAAV